MSGNLWPSFAPPGVSPDVFVAVATLSATCAGYVLFASYKTRKLRHIPSLGQNGDSVLLSQLDMVKFLTDSKRFLSQGMERVRSQVVKIPGPFSWNVVVTGQDLVEDVRKAPDSILDFQAATDENLQIKYTMGMNISTNPYHIPIVRNQLKRETPRLIPIVHEEVDVAFREYFDASVDGWKAIAANGEIMKVICRATNRTLVGLPLCRNADYVDLNVNFTVDVIKTASFLRLVPKFLRPIASWLVPTVKNRIDQGLKHLGPLIRHRQEQIQLLGDEYERPSDFLSWLMDEAEGEERDERLLSVRILVLNFAAIHTSTMTFMHALYDLASHPDYAEPLREEAQRAINEHGWSKAGLDSMVLIDSFIKESQRVRPMSALMMSRLVTQDFTLPTGVFVPHGSTLEVDALGMHQSPDAYIAPEEFNPWRFYEHQKATGKRSDMTTTTNNFLAFGHGKHACPGRFFAAVELKLMLAYLVLNYDVKCEQDGVRPPDMWVGPTIVPNPTAKLLFRRRKD